VLGALIARAVADEALYRTTGLGRVKRVIAC
jgi:hypothetical protein